MKAAIFFALTALHISVAEGVQPHCRVLNNIYQVVRPNRPGAHVPFYDIIGNDFSKATARKSYLISGDLVQTDLPRVVAEGRTTSQFVCAKFRRPDGHTVRGWLPRHDLLEIVDLDAPPDDPSQTPDDLKGLLKTLPSKSAIPLGRVWRDGKHDSDSNPFDISLIMKNRYSVLLADKAATLVDRVGVLHWVISGSNCSVTFLLFNNALLAIAADGGGCWGNHGISNPSGAYFAQ